MLNSNEPNLIPMAVSIGRRSYEKYEALPLYLKKSVLCNAVRHIDKPYFIGTSEQLYTALRDPEAAERERFIDDQKKYLFILYRMANGPFYYVRLF